MKDIESLMSDHNKLVKFGYLWYQPVSFEQWIYDKANFVDMCIEIPSNDTRSGYVEILDLTEYAHLFNFGGE